MKIFITLCLIGSLSMAIAQTKPKKDTPKDTKAETKLETKVETVVNPPATPVKLPTCFYKRIEGMVGKQKVIEMDLVKIDSLIEGTYYYKNNITPLELRGSVDAMGNITINEMGKYDVIKEKYPIMATFKGLFYNEGLIKGTLTRVKNDSIYPFELKEVYQEGSGQFDLIRKQKIHSDCNNGGMCAKFTVIFPQMKKGAATEKINKQITNALINQYIQRNNKKVASLDALIEDFIDRYKEEEKNFAQVDASIKPSWTHYNEILVVFNAQYILGLQFKSSMAESGEKPPVELMNYENFDMLTGNLLKLDDIFLKDYKPKLTAIAEEIFRKNYGFGANQPMKGFTFKNGAFELNTNFTINKKGIMFRFNPYEIATYSTGASHIFIPFENIKHLLNPNSIIGDLMKE
jgi:hypothetical protein